MAEEVRFSAKVNRSSSFSKVTARRQFLALEQFGEKPVKEIIHASYGGEFPPSLVYRGQV